MKFDLWEVTCDYLHPLQQAPKFVFTYLVSDVCCNTKRSQVQTLQDSLLKYFSQRFVDIFNRLSEKIGDRCVILAGAKTGEVVHHFMRTHSDQWAPYGQF